MTLSYILAIDQGTTSTRAVVYDAAGQEIGSAARELTQHFPKPGWVEHDPEEIWNSVSDVVPRALHAARVDARSLAAIGLTNQRETALVWDRQTGSPVCHAIVWQDRRTADFCRERKSDEPWLTAKTGLVLDPYFSATKIRWILRQDPSWYARAEAGKLACGTIDSFLIWRLTKGAVHATDATNASRTLLLDIHRVAWDDDLCRAFDVPRALLPTVRPSADSFGVTTGLDFLPDGIPIAGVAGDQQAALFGQCGFAAADAKCTYGTGAFFLLHTGRQAIASKNRLLTTLAATPAGPPEYALEGSVFIAGAAVQWLRDGLKLIESAPTIEALAERSRAEEPVIFVPALVGLGAPYWVPEARGVVFGITRSTSAADLARAILEGVALQVTDLVAAAEADSGVSLPALRVDGGMARNQRFLQIQADILGRAILPARQSESTALGAAYLAGLQVRMWPTHDRLRQLTGEARRFEPQLPAEARARKKAQWDRAVRAVVSFYQ